MTVTEISKAMNCPAGTVTTRLKSAKKIIEKEILEYEEINKERLHIMLPVPFLTRLLNAEADKTELPVSGIPNFNISSASTLATTATKILGTKSIAVITAAVVSGGGIGYYFYESHDNKKEATETAEEITYTTTADNTTPSDKFIFTYPVTETASLTSHTVITTTVSVTEKTTSETSSTSKALTTSTNSLSSTTTKITTQTSGTVAAVTTPVFLTETTITTTTSSEVTSSSVTTILPETQTEIATSATLPSNASYVDDKIDISYGYEHNAYIDSNGTLYMYGVNESGQLGDGTTENRTEPVAIMEDVKFKSVYLGKKHSAAISDDGSLYTWGLNDCGQLGNGTTENSSVPVKIMENVKSASLSVSNTIALTEDGTLYTFGNTIEYFPEPISSPTKVLENVKYADVGPSGYAAITEEGKLYTWGVDSEVAISGTIYDSNLWRYEPQLIMEDLTFVAVQQRELITGALTDSGDLYMWGQNSFGNLGINAAYSYEPVKIMENVKCFSLGISHSGAITNDGSLYTWGNNAHGQLGADVGSTSRTPVIVMEGTKFVSLKLSYYHTSAITEDNIEYCWGKN